MKCVLCRSGETEPGKKTMTLEREGVVVVFTSVPAEVCTTCGEAYTDETTTDQLLEVFEDAVRAGVKVDVREYVGPASA